jgi:hypothetical protein
VKRAKLARWVESPEFQRTLLIGLCSPFWTDVGQGCDPLRHSKTHEAKARRITRLLTKLAEECP